MSRYTYYPSEAQLGGLIEHVRREDPSCPRHDDIRSRVREKVRVVRGRISTDCKRLAAGRFGADANHTLAANGLYHHDMGRPYASRAFFSFTRSVAILNTKLSRLSVPDVAMMDLALRAALSGHDLREGTAGISDYVPLWRQAAAAVGSIATVSDNGSPATLVIVPADVDDPEFHPDDLHRSPPRSAPAYQAAPTLSRPGTSSSTPARGGSQGRQVPRTPTTSAPSASLVRVASGQTTIDGTPLDVPGFTQRLAELGSSAAPDRGMQRDGGEKGGAGGAKGGSAGGAKKGGASGVRGGGRSASIDVDAAPSSGSEGEEDVATDKEDEEASIEVTSGEEEEDESEEEEGGLAPATRDGGDGEDSDSDVPIKNDKRTQDAKRKSNSKGKQTKAPPTRASPRKPQAALPPKKSAPSSAAEKQSSSKAAAAAAAAKPHGRAAPAAAAAAVKPSTKSTPSDEPAAKRRTIAPPPPNHPVRGHRR